MELITRARLDPRVEADRYGIDLNQGLDTGTITAVAKQVLAPDEGVEAASRLHSEWMLQADVFSHSGQGGSTLKQRIDARPYELSGSWWIGENLSWCGTTGNLDLGATVPSHHEGLFLSSGHREDLMRSEFRQIGVTQEAGVFYDQGRNWNTSMVTEKFAKSGYDFL